MENDIKDNPMTYYLEPDGQYSHFNSTPYDVNTPVFIKKANMLIKRVGTTSLFSEKLMLAAIATAKRRTKGEIATAEELQYYEDIYRRTKTDFSEGLISEFSNKDIKKLFNMKTSTFYSDLNELMNHERFMSNWTIMTKDENLTGVTACITGTVYDNKRGKTLIKWNNDIAEAVLCSKGNGTMLSLELMGSFKDLQSFNTYQLLKEELSYHEYVQVKIRKQKPLLEYSTSFSLAEFRFLISTYQVSISNTENDETASKVKELLRKNRYEEAEKVLINGKNTSAYADWHDFRRYVLTNVSKAVNGFKKAQYKKDLDEYENACNEFHPTDIHFRFEELKEANSRKVTGIRFFIRWDKEKDDESIEKDKTRHVERLKNELSAILKMQLSDTDLNAMLDAAEGDTYKIKKACEYTADYEGDIDNIIGFIISAIKQDYTARPRSSSRDVKERISLDEIETKFNPENILQTEYGINTPEKNLVFNALYDILNIQKDYIKISGADRPSEYVINRVQVLKPEEIAFLISKMDDRIKSGKTLTSNYIKSMLFNAHDEYVMAGYEKTLKTSRFDYEQRKYTDEDYKMFEAKKLGIIPSGGNQSLQFAQRPFSEEEITAFEKKKLGLS